MNTKCDDSGDDNDYDCECLDGYEGDPIAGCTGTYILPVIQI